MTFKDIEQMQKEVESGWFGISQMSIQAKSRVLSARWTFEYPKANDTAILHNPKRK